MDETSKRNWEATRQALKKMQAAIDNQTSTINSQQVTITQMSNEIQNLKQQLILLSVNRGTGPTA